MNTHIRKGTSVTLTQTIARYSDPVVAKKQRIPQVGAVGTVLSVQMGTGKLLVKWTGRSWPISVDPHEVTITTK